MLGEKKKKKKKKKKKGTPLLAKKPKLEMSDSRRKWVNEQKKVSDNGIKPYASFFSRPASPPPGRPGFPRYLPGGGFL